MAISCQNTDSKNKKVQSEIASSEKNEITIKVEKSINKPFKKFINSNGLIKAQQQTQLFFKVSGEIEKINVVNTSIIQVGQIIAQLDNRQALVAIQQAQDQLKKAGFALNKLLLEYGGKDLDTLSIRPRLLESIKIQSGYYEAQTALRNAQVQYENSFLKAPFGGVVANLKTKEHNQTNPTEPFCTLLNNNLIAVEAYILESELSAVQIGQPAKVYPLAYPEKNYWGKVYEINPQVNQQGLVAIKVRIQNPDKYLFDGMNARLSIERTLANQLVVPKSAVVERSGRKVVFTYENGLAEWHYVVVSHENETEVAIAEGLKAGELVITEGNLNLGHDAKVTIKKDE